MAFAIPPVPALPEWIPTQPAIRAAAQVRAGISAQGFRVLTVSPGPQAAVRAARIAKRRGLDETAAAVDYFTTGLEPITRRLLGSRGRPDAVVADFTYVGAWIAAASWEVPYAAVFHSGLPFPSPLDDATAEALGIHPEAARHRLAEIADLADTRLRRACAAARVAPPAQGALLRPYATGLNLLTTLPDLEPPMPELADIADGPVVWTGLCSATRSEFPGEFPWERLRRQEDGPVVFVSLGTVFNDQPRLVEVLLAGAHQAGAQVVMAAGAALGRASVAAFPGDVVVARAPQLALLERVDAMITHGGNNSTTEALVAGVPLVSVPFGAEQVHNACRVEMLDVGRRLNATDLSVNDVADAVRWALRHGTQRRAAELAAGLPHTDGTAIAVDALEGMLYRS